MGENYKEVCWYNKILKEASQLLPLRCPSDDAWEQSQDATTNTELSRDSVEVDLKTQNVSSTESQDSLLVTAMSQRTENINILNDSLVKNTEESFNLLGESPKRRLSDTSVESSPKRMNFGSTRDAELACSTSLTNIDGGMIAFENKYIASIESTSDSNMEECQVVPTTSSISSEAIVDNNALKSSKILDNCGKPNMYDDIVTSVAEALDLDKTIPKPRQASVDSMLDSGIGDSCNSVDSTEKYSIIELKNRRLERHCWQPKIRESLATRLSGTSLVTFIHYIINNLTFVNC